MESISNEGMCRCCASEGTFKDFLTSYHWMGEEEIYADMLRDCFAITLYTSDDVNNGGICEVCITQLRNACNFKRQVQQTEEQFKKRVQNSGLKSNVIKLEMAGGDDGEHSDTNLSDEFSAAEFEVPIKEEKDEEKPKKRQAAKPSTSRAKKAKTEDGEPSAKRIRTIKIERRIATPRVELKIVRSRKEPHLSESKKNQHNLKLILLNSNANPIRNKDSLGYGCAFCHEQFPEPTNLKKHFLNEHNSDRLIKFMSSKLFDHVVKLDITYLNCALCNKDILKLEDLMAHLKTEHGKDIHTDIKSSIVPFRFDTPELRCAVCSAEYLNFKLLQEHMNSHFGNHICPVCGGCFMTERLLGTHVRRHKTGEFKCDDCEKVFGNKEKLKEHQKRTHLGLGKRNKCLVCNERFLDYWKKIDHMVKVHGAPPVVLNCHACDRTFRNQRALARHTKKDHLLERKHKCEECEMRFFSKSSLQRHMAKHTGVREFRCDICLKAYGRKNTLREHMWIHADNRRFACAHCGQAFVQKCSWRSHMRSKHGEEV
ncbi:telomere zinc finger-associated protein-like isoform X9 [Nymphalis io]|uniref:telomere zinc finger-associated protein-like isoform X9 n=1 Tax=Inachis io TaxID=171585 RepID=UPI0021681BB6|nr:telomere zinc finger-associated protein-like isoform X9 [Nymphalis io]